MPCFGHINITHRHGDSRPLRGTLTSLQPPGLTCIRARRLSRQSAHSFPIMQWTFPYEPTSTADMHYVSKASRVHSNSCVGLVHAHVHALTIAGACQALLLSRRAPCWSLFFEVLLTRVKLPHK